MLEKNLQRRVATLLRDRGAYSLVMHGSAMTTSGAPDIICCYHGRFLAFELKQPKQNPTPLQAHHLTRIWKAGGTCAVIRSVNDLIEFFDVIDAEIEEADSAAMAKDFIMRDVRD